MTEDEKSSMRAKIEDLKNELKSDDIESIKTKQEDLQRVLYSVSEKIYKAAAQASPQADQAAGQNQQSYQENAAGDNSKRDDVVDVDYKDVDNDSDSGN